MFAREGCTGITVSYLPEEQEDSEDAKKQIQGSGASQMNLVACDLMEEVSCRRLAESHMQRFGKLNDLANNASKQMCVSIDSEIYTRSEVSLGY